MSPVVLSVGTPHDEVHERRIRALSDAFRRLTTATGEPIGDSAASGAADPDALLRVLAASGRLVADGGPSGVDGGPSGVAGGPSGVDGGLPAALSYLPTSAALESVAAGKSWAHQLEAKQRKALRRATGAVFRLPLADGNGHIPVFITDWSPFVAACAVAVHPDHEVLSRVTIRGTTSFTGLFVRHPLHGDLLPVWVADWVKPEFGTGAVVVNPAHSVADLSFARDVGLPVRFGLGPAEPTADPTTWIDPPVVKTGRTVRAGHFDGLDHAEAATAYLNALRAAGHAEVATVTSFGRCPVGTVRPDPRGAYAWSPGRRVHGLLDDSPAPDAVRVAVEPSPLLGTAAQVMAAPSSVVVCASEAVTDALLWLQLLVDDAGGRQPSVTVVPVNRVASVKITDPAWLDAALVVAGPPGETIPLRQQVADQVARLVTDHDTTVSRLSTEPDNPAGERASAKTMAALTAGDFAGAFSGIVATAKALRRPGASVGAAESRAYLTAAHVLFGLPYPDGYGVGVPA